MSTYVKNVTRLEQITKLYIWSGFWLHLLHAFYINADMVKRSFLFMRYLQQNDSPREFQTILNIHLKYIQKIMFTLAHRL